MKTSSGSFSSKDSETDEDGRVTPSGGHNNNNGQMSMNSNSNYSCSAMLRELSKKRLKSTESSPNNTDQHPLLKSYLSSAVTQGEKKFQNQSSVGE